MAFGLINASNSIKKKETKKVKKFMQGINHELIKSNNVKKVRDLDFVGKFPTRCFAIAQHDET